jgi:hypothetical protein
VTILAIIGAILLFDAVIIWLNYRFWQIGFDEPEEGNDNGPGH